MEFERVAEEKKWKNLMFVDNICTLFKIPKRHQRNLIINFHFP